VVSPEPQGSARPSRITPLSGLVVGVVAGAAVVGLIWLLVGTSGDSTSPAGDASAACATLARVGDLKPVKGLPSNDNPSGFTPAVSDRLAAAAILAEAAARDDARYQPLNEAVGKANNSIGRQFRVDEKSIGQLEEARRQCDQL
jgi:hypothetical protein